MSSLPKVSREITDKICMTLYTMGCARWKALLKYAKALIMANGVEDEMKADLLAEKALHIITGDDKKRAYSSRYGDERIILPLGSEYASLLTLNAFEAYAELVTEAVREGKKPEAWHAKPVIDYPFHFVFSALNQELFYKVIVCDTDFFARTAYFNDTFDKHIDGKFVSMIVIPESYSSEDFGSLSFKGRVRIALIRETNKKKKRFECDLTEILGGNEL